MQLVCKSFCLLWEVKLARSCELRYWRAGGKRTMGIFESLIGQFEVYLEQSALFACAAAYLAGVLVSFTPCVYPVIPLTVAVIGGQGKVSGARGFVLSLSF